MGTESNYYKEIISKLDRLDKKEQLFVSLLGLLLSIIVIILVFSSFSFLEMIFNHSSLLRTMIFSIIVLVSAASLGFLFIKPLIRYFDFFGKKDHYKTAGKVALYFPHVKDDLLNAMQLVTIGEAKYFYSSGLIDASFKNVYERTRSINFESIVDFKKVKELSIYLFSILVIASLLFIFVPGMQAASNRIINYNQEFIPPQKYSFEVIPGNAEVTKGEDVNISIKINGGVPSSVYLSIKEEDKTNFENQKLTADTNGIYNFSYKSARNSFKYFAFAEESRSEEFTLSVIDRPIIKNLDVTVTPPAYSGIHQFQQKDNGNITALKGSRVEIKFISTNALNSSRLLFEDTTEINLSKESVRSSGNFRIMKDNSYKIIIEDFAGNKNLSPITYQIKTLYDDFPAIEMINPDGNVSLGNDNRLPLVLKVADDYGFTKLILHHKLSASRYELPQEKFTTFEIPLTKGEKELSVEYIWNLSNLSLGTDDVVSYFLEIFDNDNVSGPKSAKTEVLTIRIPSLDEILAGVEETHSNIEQDLKETIKEAEELKKELEKIDNELKQDKLEITWEEKEKIENSLDKFEKLQEKIQNASEEMNKLQQDMQENNLLSEETLEKYMELQKLMDQLTSEEMKEALKKLQDMMQNLNRQQTQDALQNFKMDEEKFKKSIERTLNLLKRIQVEQKVDELLKRSEMMTEKQEEIKKQTNESDLSDKSQNEQLNQQQEQMTKDLEKFSEELEKLSEQMDELSDMPKEEMEKMKEEFQKQKNQQQSQQASQNMKQNRKQMAMQNQEQVQQNMSKMNQQLQEMQSSMMQMNQMQTFTDMMKVLDNLISLSKQQEELKKESQQLEPNSSSFNENAQKQSNLQKNLDKILKQLSDISQKTFAITPEMGKSLGDAQREMMKSIQSLQNRNGSMASNSQGESMKSLNEAANLMKGSMESMMQGSGQGGMMSLMQQLQQMSGQQTGLNNMTQMLQKMQQGGLSPQQQAELQRLGQQQDLIRKSLEQLNKEAKEQGQSKSLSSNLDNVLKEMEEVVKDMNTEKLSDELVQKQERILSKLLDAQRSINEKDFEKNRESNTAKNILRESPSDLNLSSEEGKDKLKDELNKAVREGFTRDYENLIRRYYEALQEKKINN
ncbi:MAG TPA: DUF4175 family protein [Ignavibacteriaceae bacterium]|nr:DUF4175 family protein [Ignavibacteriaceae bacterium]